MCDMWCVCVYIRTKYAHMTCLWYVHIHIRDHKLSVYVCGCVVCVCVYVMCGWFIPT